MTKRWMQLVIGCSVFSALVLSMVKTVSADVFCAPIQFQPGCILNGPVYLEFRDRSHLQGYVGKDWIELIVRGNEAIGLTKDGEIHLVIQGNKIRGTVNEANVEWRVSEEKDVVFGYQPCLLGPVRI